MGRPIAHELDAGHGQVTLGTEELREIPQRGPRQIDARLRVHGWDGRLAIPWPGRPSPSQDGDDVARQAIDAQQPSGDAEPNDDNATRAPTLAPGKTAEKCEPNQA